MNNSDIALKIAEKLRLPAYTLFKKFEFQFYKTLNDLILSNQIDSNVCWECDLQTFAEQAWAETIICKSAEIEKKPKYCRNEYYEYLSYFQNDDIEDFFNRPKADIYFIINRKLFVIEYIGESHYNGLFGTQEPIEQEFRSQFYNKFEEILCNMIGASFIRIDAEYEGKGVSKVLAEIAKIA